MPNFSTHRVTLLALIALTLLAYMVVTLLAEVVTLRVIPVLRPIAL